MDDARKPDIAGLAIAAGLLVLAAVILWDTERLTLSAVYGLGPKAAPYVVAGGLVLLAVGNSISAWRGALPEREPYDPYALLLILGGLAALIAIVTLGGGFIIAVAVLFTATSAAFGRRALGIDALLGLLLGLLIYLAFDKLLTLSLPAGPLERLL